MLEVYVCVFGMLSKENTAHNATKIWQKGNYVSKVYRFFTISKKKMLMIANEYNSRCYTSYFNTCFAINFTNLYDFYYI